MPSLLLCTVLVRVFCGLKGICTSLVLYRRPWPPNPMCILEMYVCAHVTMYWCCLVFVSVMRHLYKILSILSCLLHNMCCFCVCTMFFDMVPKAMEAQFGGASVFGSTLEYFEVGMRLVCLEYRDSPMWPETVVGHKATTTSLSLGQPRKILRLSLGVAIFWHFWGVVAMSEMPWLFIDRWVLLDRALTALRLFGCGWSPVHVYMVHKESKWWS